MKTRRAYTLVLASAGLIAAAANCGQGSGGTGGAGAGPTDVTVTWTFSGMPADSAACMAHMAAQVQVTLNGTVDTKLHQSVTEDCTKGSVKFPGLSISDLGTPHLEGTLLNDKGGSITIAYLDVKPTPGTTKANIDFFPVMGMGGAGGMSASSSKSSAKSSSSSKASSAASSSSTAASSSSSSGAGGAPTDGGPG